jgi:hypothetical protein
MENRSFQSTCDYHDHKVGKPTCDAVTVPGPAVIQTVYKDKCDSDLYIMYEVYQAVYTGCEASEECDFYYNMRVACVAEAPCDTSAEVTGGPYNLAPRVACTLCD